MDSLDGFNCIPKTPVYMRGRARGRALQLHRQRPIPRHRFKAIACYHGNYEGDITMFSGDETRLMDTDSEKDYYSDFDESQRRQGKFKFKPWINAKAWISDRFNRMERLTRFINDVQQNVVYRKIYELIGILLFIVLALLQFAIRVVVGVSNWTYGLWKSKLFLRNTIRSVLWWLTLSTCNDIGLFALILIITPILFAISLVGFFLSVYCFIKECITKWSIAMHRNLCNL